MSDALAAAKRLASVAAKQGRIRTHQIFTPADKALLGPPKRGAQKAIMVDGEFFPSGYEVRKKFKIHYSTLKRWINEGKASYAE